MILLDTNVVSEPLRPLPNLQVIAWIDAQPLETLFLSAITIAELRAGVAPLPAGKRRTGLRQRLEARVLPLFAGRVLPSLCRTDRQGPRSWARHCQCRRLRRGHRCHQRHGGGHP